MHEDDAGSIDEGLPLITGGAKTALPDAENAFSA
jgi:hypothetical protein